MATYYCYDGSTDWKPLDDSVDLKEFALNKLKEESHRDSDGGYFYYIEFWRDGVSTFAFSEYDGCDSRFNMDGAMSLFEYGTLEDIHAVDGYRNKYVKANPYSPDRDYIRIKK